jgi:hypothetical protein
MQHQDAIDTFATLGLQSLYSVARDQVMRHRFLLDMKAQVPHWSMTSLHIGLTDLDQYNTTKSLFCQGSGLYTMQPQQIHQQHAVFWLDYASINPH